MRFKIALSVIIAIVGIAANSRASEIPCSHAVEKTVSLRSSKQKEFLRVEIGSGPCNDAMLSISVRERGGRTLYRYFEPLTPHIAIDGFDPELPKYAKAFVSAVIAQAVSTPPEILPFETDGIQTRLLIPAPKFRSLMKHKSIFFYHPTHYESGQYLVWDSKSKQFVIIAAF
jgi:hypothetical protein